MKKTAINLTLLLLLVVASLAVSTLPAKAGPKTIIVPDQYSTVMAALENADNGDIIFFKEGTYEGPINQTIIINKALTIVGESAEKTIIKLYPAYNVSWLFATPFYDYSDAITVTADDFRLLNLTLAVSNPGGYISAAGNRIQIAGTNITMGPSTGLAVHGSYCKITDNKIGGFIQVNGTFNEVARNTPYNIYSYGSFNLVRNNRCQGIWLYNSTDNVFLENEVWTDSRGYSGFALTASQNNYFYKNKISGFSSGFLFWYSSENTVKANTVADSLTASVDLGASYNNGFYLNNFVENLWWVRGYVYDQYSDPNYRDAFPNMTASVNFWDNGTMGNYWGNYNGTDLNRDGIGDVPYSISFEQGEEFVCGQDSFPLMARVDISSATIEMPPWVADIPPEPQPVNPQVTDPMPQEPDPGNGNSDPLPEPEDSDKQSSFPAALAVAVAAVVAVVCLGLLVYIQKRRR